MDSNIFVAYCPYGYGVENTNSEILNYIKEKVHEMNGDMSLLSNFLSKILCQQENRHF